MNEYDENWLCACATSSGAALKPPGSEVNKLKVGRAAVYIDPAFPILKDLT